MLLSRRIGDEWSHPKWRRLVECWVVAKSWMVAEGGLLLRFSRARFVHIRGWSCRLRIARFGGCCKGPSFGLPHLGLLHFDE